ncbi:MAG: hypothetical protein ACP5XB_29065 [Isosphaeraceae bacterium]
MRFLMTTLGAALLALAWGSIGRADTWTASATTVDSKGTNLKDGPLDAQAVFTITTGQIQVTITNLLDPTKITSIGQAVSDLSFTLSNAPGTNGTDTASGQLVTVASGGGVTDASGSPTRWIDSSIGGGVTISGNTVQIEAIGHGSPTELILPDSNGGSYSSANSSILPDTALRLTGRRRSLSPSRVSRARPRSQP